MLKVKIFMFSSTKELILNLNVFFLSKSIPSDFFCFSLLFQLIVVPISYLSEFLHIGIPRLCHPLYFISKYKLKAWYPIEE